MKRITYLATVSQHLSLNNTSMRLILPILTLFFIGCSLSLSAQTVVDFTDPTTATYTDASITNNAPQIQVGSVMAMWRSDVNSDGNLNTVDFILTRVNSNPSQSGVYQLFDVNLDGNVNTVDFILARVSTNPSKTEHLP